MKPKFYEVTVEKTTSSVLILGVHAETVAEARFKALQDAKAVDFEDGRKAIPRYNLNLVREVKE
jgi:hypothetical protein